MARGPAAAMVIDDFTAGGLCSRLGTRWRGVSDQVMGGISLPRVVATSRLGRPCLSLTGDVRLENQGGFIQAVLDLAADGGVFDAGAWHGIRLTVCGNGEDYAVHLRTSDCLRPWQSYRAGFIAGNAWQALAIAFSEFRPHRLREPMDVRCLRRLGLVAIGRAFHADLAVAHIAFYAAGDVSGQ